VHMKAVAQVDVYKDIINLGNNPHPVCIDIEHIELKTIPASRAL